ncbi:MAG TPA: class I poly(R)-hydroxyalkanoic acid synthase [Alphaproteobacteria bacterium]|nr:class I poly(R)-hydroxyalkanoic acid synthase [Alphaproteobacteria bacterium]
MTKKTDDRPDQPEPDPQALARNMMTVAAQSQKLVNDFLKRQAADGTQQQMDPLNIGSAFLEMTSKMMADPSRALEAQMKFLQDSAHLWTYTVRRFMGDEAEPVIEPAKGDRRFKDREWQENAVFDYIKQSYLLAARWMQHTVEGIDGLDPKTAKKVDFYTRQFTDAMAPTNFALTNPEVLRTTIESNGENLVNGLNNMLADLERGDGRLKIRMSDEQAFKVGENLATTPGKVVLRTDLFELIQYTPTTKEVYERPLLVFPPWINKFYIMDLKPENSFIRWMVDQGYTVFIVSWVNPDARLADKTFEAYMLEGIIKAVDAVEEITGSNKINTIGYCIAGTLLSATLSYMAVKKDRRIASATFLAAQVDFSEPGELEIFVDDEQLKSIDARMSRKGYLEGNEMATTFNMLRANDLIWSFVINNYLLGKDPFPFDLLYWNGDSTRMPRALHIFYLREMYRDNNLAKPGGITLDGVPIDLRKVRVPVYLQAAREDHIAPYPSVYRATKLFKGKIRFILAGSGHIAGVINAPAANKYQYWTNEDAPTDLNRWLDGATEHPGSWWPDWDAWLSPLSGKKVPARKPGSAKYKPICDAPGTYVLVKS